MKFTKRNARSQTAALSAAILFASGLSQADVKVEKLAHHEQFNIPTFMRGPHVMDWFKRENLAFRRGAAIHAAHGAAHDLALLTQLQEAAKEDEAFSKRFVELTAKHPPKTEAVMQTYGPTTSQFAWDLYRAINWTHIHHSMTYDIMASQEIPWNMKKAWTDKAVKYYLENSNVAMSPAPLDYTMRRAGTLMKPYLTYFRNYYPQSNNYFYVAHWWHPAIYEAQMIAGNDEEQEMSVHTTDQLVHEAFKDRPQRMILSREMMPRYARMSPESANIFDNLHMLHGFTYDILSYPNWTKEQKEAELYRVIKALSYHPGDEHLARKVSEPYPNVDPRQYEPWMKACEGAMHDIMHQMLDEMMPAMVTDYASKRTQAHEAAMKKLCPGKQIGETEGSLHDALMVVFPDMKKMPGTKEPGESNPVMMQTMMKGWLEKQGNKTDLAPISMQAEPNLPPVGQMPKTFQNPGESEIETQGKISPGAPQKGSQTKARISGAKSPKRDAQKKKTGSDQSLSGDSGTR